MRNDRSLIRRKGYGPNTWRNIQITNTGLEENRKLYGKKDILTVFHILACLWTHFAPVSTDIFNKRYQFPQIDNAYFIYLTTLLQNRYSKNIVLPKKKKIKITIHLFHDKFHKSLFNSFHELASYLFLVRPDTNFQKFLFDLSYHYFIPTLSDLWKKKKKKKISISRATH